MEDSGRQAIMDALRNVYSTAENYSATEAELEVVADKLGDVSQVLLGGRITLHEEGEEYFDRLGRAKAERKSRETLSADAYRERLMGVVRSGADWYAREVESGKTTPEIEAYLSRVPEMYVGLARVFCSNFGRPPLKGEDAMWRRGWTDQYQIGITPAMIREAFERMSDRRLSIKISAKPYGDCRGD